MRIPALVAIGAVLFAGPVWAQAWNDYTSDADGFTVSVPVAMTVRNGVFTMADGSKYPSHVHTGRQDSVIFSVTVVDLSKAPVGGDTAIDLAARAFTKTGAVQMDVPSRTGNPPITHRGFGREIDVIRKDGSESTLQIFLVGKRLYIMEGKSLPPDAADHTLVAIRFEESISFPRTPADDAIKVMDLIPPAPASDQPVAIAVKAPGNLTERWRWAPGGGLVQYCRQQGQGAETCAVADNPEQGDHMPASATPPVISSVQPGQAWILNGGAAYFCKHTSYKAGSPLEVTCALATRGGLAAGTPILAQAVADGAARFFVMPGYRSMFCRNVFPAPDGDPSQVALACQAL